MNTTLEHKRIYLDYASSTPVDASVLAYMYETEKTIFGNASALHKEGRDAKALLDAARHFIGDTLHAHADEIIFTSGGTESDNLAILGVVNAFVALYKHTNVVPHLIISTIEHPAILETVLSLQQKEIIEVSFLEVNELGIVNPEDLKELIKDTTVLISVIHANNEIGTIQPIQEIAKIIRHFKKHKKTESLFPCFPLLHTDACQSFVYQKINIETLGVDLLTINSSKIYGPKGVGALYVKRNTPLHPEIYGGDQEKKLRAGTENISRIIGFQKAIEINELMKSSESIRMFDLKKQLLSILKDIFPMLLVNGDVATSLPNILNITIPCIKSEQFVIYADTFGLSLSEKSACKADAGGISHVILALRKNNQKDKMEEEGSIRFSLGRHTTTSDLVESSKRVIKIKELLL